MKNDEEMQSELRELTRGLLFMSESDYPFEIVRWEGVEELTPEHLRRIVGVDPASPLEERTIADFFRVAAGEQEWKGGAELASARKYQSLMRLLEDNLRDVRAYRVGAVNIGVYVVGKSVEGNWLGVSTRVVET
ncbi:MAG TPA: nuclease A inhibitor family protein [Pyrinomonadaceae bacterium]|nr:nuclease A inhibitor family protein [Pyrinomonadaceae bacterium]